MNTQSNKANKKPLISVQELVIFALLGALMFISDLIMEFLPNIHILGLLIIVYTLIFRVKAIIPIYVYVFLSGVFAGFALWWLPYLYIWTILWAVTLLLPKNLINKKIGYVVYPAVCFLHQILFGVFYAPADVLMLNFNAEQLLAWIGTGTVFNILPATANMLLGIFTIRLTKLLKKILKITDKA